MALKAAIATCMYLLCVGRCNHYNKKEIQGNKGNGTEHRDKH